MAKLFGTDGIRGIVNEDLNAILALKIGSSVAKVLKNELKKDKLTLLIGGDTRISKDMLTSSVAAGVLSEGCDVISLGVLPTPAISYLVKEYNADGAFIISASHNPSKYNGIKVLDNNGFKLTEELEEKVEELIFNFELNNKVNDNGVIITKSDAIFLYVNHLISTIDSDISNLKIIIDTANGAASKTAEVLFNKLNANFTLINNNPDGLNINENAGSTHIESLVELVKKGDYDIGIAYDGDADRCILVDDQGNVIDGDFIIAICGSLLKREGKLKNNALVGTIMSNLGLIKFCEENDIKFAATKVGDKYVLESMLNNNYILGGEQSGHIIFKECANTGDGELTSLQVLNVMSKEGKKLSELANVMKKYPQVMINVNVSKEGKENYKTNENIKKKIAEVNEKLNGDGRVVVRPSGTENLIRVMLEGKDEEIIKSYCENLANYIENELK